MDPIKMDINAKIGATMGDAPTAEWAVTGPDGSELFRCPSLDLAERALNRIRPLLDTEAANSLRITEVVYWPDYLDGNGAGCANARYCAWALRQLGHVTIFAFSRENGGKHSDTLFMVIGRDGQRVERPTLATALYELLLRSDNTCVRFQTFPTAHLQQWADDQA